jgi:hypothetical protein
MMPTSFAMALAVTGWSPVIMMTLMPADRHLVTASCFEDKNILARGQFLKRNQDGNLQIF